jgi:hypothetical protein
MRQPIADRVAAELDRAADLGGALRSALWFLAATSVPSPSAEAWRNFHIEQTARRVTDVDWTTVFAPKVDRRTWLAALTLAALTLATLGWPLDNLRPSAPAPIAASAAASATSGAEGLNAPALSEGLRAIKSGRVPSTESLAAVGRALDVAKLDAAARTHLDELFRDTPRDRPIGTWSGQPQDDDGDVDERARALVNPWALEWAYQDAVSRASAAKPLAPKGESASPGNDTVPNTAGEQRPAATGRAGTDGAAVLGQAHGQTAGFSSLLFGRQQAEGTGGPEQARDPAQTSRTPALTTALRQEVIRASSDIRDASPSGLRRASDNDVPAIAASRSDTRVTYDRGRGSQPPIIPAERRGLVHDALIRPIAGAADRPE